MSTTVTLHDRDYAGPRWRYGLTFRPLGNGTPDKWIIFSDRSHPAFRHGTVDYPRELAPRDVDQLSLTFIEHIPARTASGEESSTA